MKKLLIMMIILVSGMLTSCNKSNDEASLENVISYIENLESYSYQTNMIVKRNNKEMDMKVDVIYKKPYYNICFSNSKLDSQYIVKNSEGVFVLTPKVDKKFEFTSDWPLNSSHAYILASVVNDIKNDKTCTASIVNNKVIITSKVSSKTNSNVCKMDFEFDFNTKLPVKTTFYNESNESIITVSFSNFKENIDVSNDKFNTELIMSQNQNETTSSIENEIVINCNYTINGVSLASKVSTEDYQILCYTGDTSYTIVCKTNTNIMFDGRYSYNDYDLDESGLILYNDLGAYTIKNDLEVCVYSTSLNNDELYSIISEISFA